MLEKLMKNKLFWIAIISILLIGIIVTFAISNKDDSGESKDNGVKIETGQDDKEPYDGTGLDVIEDEKGNSEDSINASGSWDEPSKDSGTKDNNAKNENTKPEENNQGNTNQNDEQKNDGNDDESGIEEDTLIDEKEWSNIY